MNNNVYYCSCSFLYSHTDCVDENIHRPFDRIVCYLTILETVVEKFIYVLHVAL